MKNRCTIAALVSAALMGALFLGACENPAGNEPGEDTAMASRTTFEDAGISYGTDQAKNGAVAGILRIPAEGGPWTAELVEGAEDNALFTLEDGSPEEDGEGNSYDIKNIVISNPNGEALDWGPYAVSVKISGASGSVFHKTLRFNVSLTPAPFKKAPSVYPYITGLGKNKLSASWPMTSGAEGYRVYVGTDPDARPATPYQVFSSPTATSVEITDLEGDDPVGVLPDGTTYYVWVAAYNGSGDTLSPRAARPTSFTIDPYWYELNGDPDFNHWDSRTDAYQFKYDAEAEEWIITCGYSWFQDHDIYYREDFSNSQPWRIKYHLVFDTVRLNSDVPGTTQGHYTSQEDLRLDFEGNPAPSGVFIVQMPDTRFYAVYYWGFKTVQTNPNHAGAPIGTVHAYLSNAYATGGGPVSGLCYGQTLPQAIDTYTYENFKWFVAGVAVPWYPITADGQWIKGYEEE